MENKLVKIIVAYKILVDFPISLACIIIGSSQVTECNLTDIIGLNITDFLLGFGIYRLISVVVSLLTYYKSVGFEQHITRLIIDFEITWTIIGGVVLFRTNLSCINERSLYGVFGLLIWCYGIINMIFSNLISPVLIKNSY